MTLSAKTVTAVATNIVADVDDLYPTATLFPDLSAASVLELQNATLMRLSDDVPKVSYDMNKLFTWKHGDTVRGTHAKAHKGMQGYIKDINKAYGKQKSYKAIYIDTFKPIGPQLKKLKK